MRSLKRADSSPTISCSSSLALASPTHAAPVVLLDGFPRTLGQAETLEPSNPARFGLRFSSPCLSQRFWNAWSREGVMTTKTMCCENVCHLLSATLGRCWPGTTGAVISSSVDGDQPQADVTIAAEALLATASRLSEIPRADPLTPWPRSEGLLVSAFESLLEWDPRPH